MTHFEVLNFKLFFLPKILGDRKKPYMQTWRNIQSTPNMRIFRQSNLIMYLALARKMIS